MFGIIYELIRNNSLFECCLHIIYNWVKVAYDRNSKCTATIWDIHTWKPEISLYLIHACSIEHVVYIIPDTYLHLSSRFHVKISANRISVLGPPRCRTARNIVVLVLYRDRILIITLTCSVRVVLSQRVPLWQIQRRLVSRVRLSTASHVFPFHLSDMKVHLKFKTVVLSWLLKEIASYNVVKKYIGFNEA